MEARTALVVLGALFAGSCTFGRRPPTAGRAAAAQPLYWADLGPDAVDVSAYPPEQQRNYKVYAAVCSRCHTLARSVNAPVASRAYWDMYMLGMRAISRVERSAPIPKDERKAILDFLEYDSKIRKIDDAASFEKRTAELKRRFEPILRERMRELQESPQPIILAP